MKKFYRKFLSLLNLFDKVNYISDSREYDPIIRMKLSSIEEQNYHCIYAFYNTLNRTNSPFLYSRDASSFFTREFDNMALPFLLTINEIDKNTY